MYKQGDREYTLKGTYLEVKHYYGLLTRKLAILQTMALGDVDFDLLEKYESDIQKFTLSITQIEEACEAIESQIVNAKDGNEKRELLAKIPELKKRRNYDSIKANYKACLNDFAKDRKAQRQKKLRDELYASALIELMSDEAFIMESLRNILNGDIEKLEYDVVFAMAVLTDFFTFVKENNPLLRNYKDNTTIN